jgi:hypothetical protein
MVYFYLTLEMVSSIGQSAEQALMNELCSRMDRLESQWYYFTVIASGEHYADEEHYLIENSNITENQTTRGDSNTESDCSTESDSSTEGDSNIE